MMNDHAPPERLTLAAGPLPAPRTLPQPHPFETVTPVREIPPTAI
jgi:hypothetical protein